MMMCRSCGDLPTSTLACNQTLISEGHVLTSGYRSGQDRVKPRRDPTVYSSGKCSHGGYTEYSGKEWAALGGINKDSTRKELSPHNYLHPQAIQAAMNHTEYFFNDKDYGLRYLIDESTYKLLLQLKAGTSLAFNIDYSGSMSDDIEAVKQQVIEITEEFQGTINEPSNYVVSLFSDPENLTKIFQTEDGHETIEFIRGITVEGGGDCPEYLLDGLVKALQVINPHSVLRSFTDASAKDPEKQPFVLNLATSKDIRLDFLLTGHCSSRKRRESQNAHRQARSVGDLYSALSAATGGNIYETDKGGIDKLANVIKATAAVSVTVLKQKLTPISFENIDVDVDNTVAEFTVEITGGNGITTDIYNPSGGVASASVTDLGSGKILKIGDPGPGTWKVTVKNTNQISVTVTAKSSLDITSSFMQIDEKTEFEFELTGRPISSDNATMLVFVPSKSLVGEVDTIRLVDSDGNVFANYNNVVEQTSRSDTGQYKVRFPFPQKSFQVVVSGEDSDGNRFTRLQTKMIVPVAVKLSLMPTSDQLYVGESVTIGFVVVNRESSRSDITVTISNDQGFHQSPSSHIYHLGPLQNATGSFSLTAGSIPDIATTVTITTSTGTATGETSQYGVTRLFTKKRTSRIEDNIAPSCNITAITGDCGEFNLDPCTCADHKWIGSATIWDEGFGLFKTSASIEMFEHDTFEPGHSIVNGSIKATIWSDCCNPRVYITTVDMASNTGTCVFDLAPDTETPLPECKPTVSGQDASSSSSSLTLIATLAVVATVGVVAVVGGGLYIVKRNQHVKRTMKP